MKPPKGMLTQPPQVATRSEGARQLMDLRWDYPVYKPKAAPAAEHGTDVEQARAALPREEALRILSGDDPRPLLVLRECEVCNKTDDALLSRNENNERTLILARWFHCVKLPVDVVKPDHPFNALFPTNDAEHLFVASRDGSAKQPLESDTSRVELWTAMERTLATSYDMDPGKTVKQVLMGLDRVDQLERKARDLEQRKGELMETPRVDPAKVRKVQTELETVQKDAAEARAAVARLFEAKPRAAQAGAAR
jgi:hypothetical protein